MEREKNVYNAACKIACRVGGAGPDGSPAELQRKPNTWEPVNFHSYTAEIWQELFHSHSVVGVIDFTTGPGYVAEAAMMEKIPYVGFVQTPMGEHVVRRYLFQRLWALMRKPGSSHYESALRDLFVEKTTGGEQAAKAKAKSGGGASSGPEPGRTKAAAKAKSGSANANASANPSLIAALKALEARPANKHENEG